MRVIYCRGYRLTPCRFIVAKWTGTIAYEVLCTIGPRVPRLYHEG